MPVLLNQQGLAEDLQPDHAEQALAAGTHSLPLVSPEGEPVSVSPAERDQHLSQGYKLPSTEQLQSLLEHAKYSTTGQTLGAGLEGAAETATLGLSGKAEEALGIPKEEQLKREKHHPVAHAVGEAAGIIAPSLLGEEAGALNVLGKVGDAAEAGAKALSGSAKDALANKLAGWAGRGAAEGAMLSGEHVLNESLLGDPSMNAEHALTEVGISSLFGGAGGAILGKAAEEGGNLSGKLFDKEGGLLSGLTKVKENAGDIHDAAARLGVEPLPGQLSASRTVQDLQSQIAKEPTIMGRREQANVDNQFQAIRKATTDALGESAPMTKAEVGESLRKGIQDKLQETYKPISDAYDYLKTELKEVPLDDSSLLKATRAIRGIEGVRVSPSSPEYKLAENVAEEVRNLTNVTELRAYSQSIARQTAGNPALKYVGNAIKGVLSDMEENAISSSAKNMVAAGRMSQGELDLLNHARASTKLQYKSLMGQMGELGDVLGKRRVYGPQDFLNHVADLPAEKLADRLFQKNNSKFLSFLSDNFPAQAETLARYQKSVIAEKAFKDGAVNAAQALREVDKLEPEVQKFLFSKEDLQKLEDARTLTEAMPKDVNPSGTAKAKSLGDMLNPAKHLGSAALGSILTGSPAAGLAVGTLTGSLGAEVSSALKKSLLSRLVSARPEEAARHQAIGALSDLVSKTTKGVATAARGMFSKEAGERLTLSKEESNRFQEKLSKLSGDPQKMIDRMTKLTDGMSEHAPDTASAISTTAGKAVAYLTAQLPKTTQVSAFSAPVKPSAFQTAAFNRAAEAVLDPIGVMSRVSDGTISTSDVQALQTVYPNLYSSMRQAVTSQMADAVTKGATVPYKTRLGLSLFLGEPVDRTLTPSSIMSIQGSFQTGAQRQANTDQQSQAAVAGGRPKHSATALSKVGQQTSTPEQAAAARRTRS